MRTLIPIILLPEGGGSSALTISAPIAGGGRQPKLLMHASSGDRVEDVQEDVGETVAASARISAALRSSPVLV